MTLVPQRPVLLKGTIRDHLDPFKEYRDSELWAALTRCRLLDMIHRFPSRLETPVFEEGANLSVGEQQLLCLCRAFLRQSKILCLDEAFCHLDDLLVSDIQFILDTVFRSVTVLLITHR